MISFQAEPEQRPRPTDRQLELLAVLVDEGTYERVAQRLGISRATVRNMLYICRKQTGASSTYDLIYRMAVGEYDR